MKKCVLVGASPMLSPVTVPGGAFIIAADGGLDTVKKMNLTPDVIIGDFDSLGYVPEGEKVIKLPVRKDDTDSFAAFKYAFDAGCRDFLLLGVLGGETGHTLANLSLAAYGAKQGARMLLTDGVTRVTAVSDGRIGISGGEGKISVFCWGEKAEGVSLSGLEYTLENGVLYPEIPLGVSNAFCGENARIGVAHGTLLITFEKGELIYEQ